MSKYLGFVISHGDLSEEINKLTRYFIQAQLPLYPFSNRVQSIENIVDEIQKKIDSEKPEYVLIFVDLQGGSCWQAAIRIKHNFSKTAIISGINLPLLLSFGANFQRLEFGVLVEKILEDGKKGIQLVR